MRHTFTPKKFDHLIGMEGFTVQLLKNHFKLYEGYVENTNKLLETLAETPTDGKDPNYAELSRRLGFELNGMRLHEYYFENLGGDGDFDLAPTLAKELKSSYGDFDTWKEIFVATGAIRGVGWCILYRDPITGGLISQWIGEHEVGHPAGWTPVLVMDLWEHAYMLDYGTERKGYIEAFFANVNWAAVETRVKEASRQLAGTRK